MLVCCVNDPWWLQVEDRCQELRQEIANEVREEEQMLKGRQSRLQRWQVQADQASAFAQHAINNVFQPEKLLSKSLVIRQLHKLQNLAVPATELPVPRLNLCFENAVVVGPEMCRSLGTAVKAVLSEFTVRILPCCVKTT